MTILKVAGRTLDLDASGSLAEVNTANTFDSLYGVNSMYGPGEADYMRLIDPGNHSDVWFHFRYYSVGSGNYGGTANALVIFDTNGTPLFTMAKTTSLGANVTPVVLGTSNVTGVGVTLLTTTIYFIDIQVVVSGSTTTVSIYINGTLNQTLTNSNNGGRLNPKGIELYPNRFRYGSGLFGYVSEFFLSTTMTIGQRLASLRVDSNGSLTGFTGTITDLNTIDASTGMVSDTPGQRHTWNPTAYGGPSKSVAAVVASMRAEWASGTPSKVAQFLRIGSANYDGSDVTIGTMTMAQEIWHTNPATSAVWATSDLASLQVGMKSAA